MTADDHPRPPGYRRIAAAGDSFPYADASGRPVTDAAVIARIRALALPPAWRDVWVAAEPGAKVQAVGVDRAGRTQYRYSADWTLTRAAEKFAHVNAFIHAYNRGRTISDAVAASAERSGDDRLALVWRDPAVQEATLKLLS